MTCPSLCVESVLYKMNQKEETSLQESHILLPLLWFSGLCHYFYPFTVLFLPGMLKQQHGMVSTGWHIMCQEFGLSCSASSHWAVDFILCSGGKLHLAALQFSPQMLIFCASWDSLQRVLLPGPSLHSSVVLGWLWLRLSPCRTRILVQPCTVEHLCNISSCWCPNMCISHYLGYCFPVLFLLFPTGLTSGGSHSSRALLNIAHVDCFILKSSRAYRGKNTE